MYTLSYSQFYLMVPILKHLPLYLQQSEQPITKLINSNRDDPPYNTNSYPGFDHEFIRRRLYSFR